LELLLLGPEFLFFEASLSMLHPQIDITYCPA
jgi:hypothetical protein